MIINMNNKRFMKEQGRYNTTIYGLNNKITRSLLSFKKISNELNQLQLKKEKQTQITKRATNKQQISYEQKQTIDQMKE